MVYSTRMGRPLGNTVCAELFKALADPTRLKILHALFTHEQCVSDLVETLRVTQPLVSHHLKILKTVGLLESRREGQKVRYALHPEVRAKLSEAAPGLDLGCCEVRFRR